MYYWLVINLGNLKHWMGQEGSLCGNKAIKINNRKSITSPVVNNAETVVGD